VFVLDACAVIAWAFRDEGASLDALIARVAEEPAVVPAHWLLEVDNALLMGERRGRIKAEQREEILAHISRLPIRVDEETSLRGWQEVPELAVRHRLTAYDAAYLELALRLNVPLATLDADLARAARSAKVRLLPLNHV
jgi:predicted nucleic acid-binding protein